MKTIKYTFFDKENINIYLFGDEHIGDAHCDVSYIKNRIEECRLDPNGYAIVLGDIMNIATKDSVSFGAYGDICSPMEQIRQAVELFEPIQDKILVWLDGNHEDRITKSTSLQVGKIIAAELDVYYAENSALLFVRFGKTSKDRPICYTVFCRHGSGGGAKIGAKMSKLRSNSEIIDADIYIQGHTHTPAVFQEDYYRISFQNSSADKVTHTFVNLGSSLEYGGYGERFGIAPSTKNQPVIHLHNLNKRVTVTM